MAVRRRTCPKCGRKVEGDSQFCRYCGTELPAQEKYKPEENELICPVCGRKAAAGASFCMGCGSPLARQQNPPQGSSGIICPVCGKRAAAGAAFCMGCGSPLTRQQNQQQESSGIICPSCGKRADKGAQFCLFCGSPLQGNAPVRQGVGFASVKKLQGAFSTAASAVAGEMDFGDMGSVVSKVAEFGTSSVFQGAAVDSPAEGIVHFLGSYLGGLFGMLIKPKTLLYSACSIFTE